MVRFDKAYEVKEILIATDPDAYVPVNWKQFSAKDKRHFETFKAHEISLAKKIGFQLGGPKEGLPNKEEQQAYELYINSRINYYKIEPISLKLRYIIYILLFGLLGYLLYNIL